MDVTPEQVDAMLLVYKEYASRCKLLEERKRFLEADIDFYSNLRAEDVVQTTAPLSGMPRGGTTSDPTGRIGIMLADGDGAGKIPGLRRELRQVEMELREKQPTVVFVDALLIALNDRERFVVEGKAINGLTWRQLENLFKVAFGEAYSQQGLKKSAKPPCRRSTASPCKQSSKKGVCSDTKSEQAPSYIS